MRRLLPVALCVAASTGLMACDQESVSGPTPNDAQDLYDEVRKAPFPVPAGPALADGDVELRRGGGGDIVIFVVEDGVASRADGTPVQFISTDEILSPEGEVLCTQGASGGFVQLRDSEGTVVFSSIGPFVFEGQPQLAGKNPAQQAQELASRLRFSFDFEMVVEGFANSGEEMVEASVPVQFASNWRKVVIASLIDGYCGSEGIPE